MKSKYSYVSILSILLCLFLTIPTSCKKDEDNDDDNNNNLVIGSTYSVYGGANYISGVDGYHPENFGYDLIGSATATAIFYGSYNYYILVVYPVNIAYVDAVEGSYSTYFGTSTTGNTMNGENVEGEPDGLSAVVGGLYNGRSGGYIVIDAIGYSLSSIKVYISNP